MPATSTTLRGLIQVLGPTKLMSDFGQNILLLILGWLFGLLSPAVIEAIRSKREASRGRTAILCELDELAYVLSLATYSARKAAGTLDRPFLEWFNARIASDMSEGAESTRAVVRAMLERPDEEISECSRLSATADQKGTMLQKYPAPLLDSRVSALWTFDTEYQRKLLEIHRNIALLDGIVDKSRDYFFLTFSQLSSDNHRLVSGNLVQCYGNYAKRSQIIVDKIQALKSTPGA